MATFIVLAGFTDQGIRNVKETISRAEAFKEMAKKNGVTIKDMYWTLGQYDVIAICEAPDDEAATALSLSVCSRGNVRSMTLRAFSFDEMKKILGKMV
ncbi:MAG: GYD domain-containing protein, partial [Methyloceanibacter sp.]